MAKIEMDLSEYEVIMESKRLLEEANAKLNAAYEENKKLQQEKIEVLKKNENTVTIIKRVNSFQTMYVRKPEIEVVRYFQKFGFDIRNFYGSRFESFMKDFIDNIFEIKTIESSRVGDDYNEEILSQPLEQFQDEMLAKLKKELEPSIIAQLKSYEKKNAELSDDLKRISESDNKNYERFKDADELATKNGEEIIKLSEQISVLKKEISVANKGIDEIKPFVELVIEQTNNIPLFDKASIIKNVNWLSKNYLKNLNNE